MFPKKNPGNWDTDNVGTPSEPKCSLEENAIEDELYNVSDGTSSEDSLI